MREDPVEQLQIANAKLAIQIIENSKKIKQFKFNDTEDCDLWAKSGCCTAPFWFESDICSDCKDHASCCCDDCDDFKKCLNENKVTT